ncbi:MAG: TonB-dependent receptor plug domain-containing protein [Bacteroidota bacterium]
MRQIGYMVMVLASLNALAQHTFTVKGNDGEPLVGATALVRDINTNEEEQLIADIDGRFATHLTLPAEIEIRYVGYETLKTVVSAADLDIRLKPSVAKLEDVVVTGQLVPQSIDQSVYTVKTIDKKRIEAQGAVDLADVLSNNLNITLTPQKGDGRTEISMMGLDGQYVKVLVDGVPFVSVDGNGNNVDFTQINLNSIERIEIVEGPMAVSYGSNAVAGVINIITNRKVVNEVFLQEESVGSEYGLDRGRHIQSVSLGRQLGENVLVQGSLLRNDFKGFFNGFQGADHLINDGLRGHDWLPKTQYNGNIGVSYGTDKFYARYRYDYFTQRLDRYNRNVIEDEHPSSGIVDFVAEDTEFETDRFSHNLILEGALSSINYNIVSTYSKVNSDVRRVRNLIETGTRQSLIDQNQQFFESRMSRGSFTNFTTGSKAALELGYEYTYESFRDPGNQAFGIPEDFRDTELGTEQQSLSNLAGFANVEWSISDQVMLRPGVRGIYNDLYASSPLIYSLHGKFGLGKGFDLRVTSGTSYRTPNLEELYRLFVDANHFVIGTPDLAPENGLGVHLDLKKRFNTSQDRQFNSSFKLFYNRIEDKIAIARFAVNPDRFRYLNVDLFMTQGVSWVNEVRLSSRLSGTFGFSYIGRYNELLNEVEDLPETFFYSPEANLILNYHFEKPGISLATFYKHTGSVQQYASQDGQFVLGEVSAFNWLDTNITWRASNLFSLQSGVKNILDITDIRSTAESDGAHSGAANSRGLTYGRSYFLKATFNF